MSLLVLAVVTVAIIGGLTYIYNQFESSINRVMKPTIMLFVALRVLLLALMIVGLWASGNTTLQLAALTIIVIGTLFYLVMDPYSELKSAP